MRAGGTAGQTSLKSQARTILRPPGGVLSLLRPGKVLNKTPHRKESDYVMARLGASLLAAVCRGTLVPPSPKQVSKQPSQTTLQLAKP